MDMHVQIGRHGPIALGAFHQKLFTSDRSCLFAVGDVPHGHLVKLGEYLNLGKGAGMKLVTTKHFHFIEEPAVFGILNSLQIYKDVNFSSIHLIFRTCGSCTKVYRR